MINTTIVNVVATAALNHKLDLYEIGEFREILHDPEIYGGVAAYFKTSAMEGKVTIFASGKMISVGTRKEETAFRELELAKDFLVKKNLLKPTKLQPRTRNIVVQADFGRFIDLEQLTSNYRMIYEPEQFPGAILKIKDPHKTTVLLFASGKAVITGLTSSTYIKPVAQKLADIISSV